MTLAFLVNELTACVIGAQAKDLIFLAKINLDLRSLAMPIA